MDNRSSNQLCVQALKDLCRAYVSTLEAARDRIIAHGGGCDPVEVMEHCDPALRKARETIAQLERSAVELAELQKRVEFAADALGVVERRRDQLKAENERLRLRAAQHDRLIREVAAINQDIEVSNCIEEAKRILDGAAVEKDALPAFERGCYVLMEMMKAYERRVRTDCRTPEDLAKRPWECAEYVAAANYLRAVWRPEEKSEPSPRPCKYCGEERTPHGTFHRGGCEGLQDVKVSRLRLDYLIENGRCPNPSCDLPAGHDGDHARLPVETSRVTADEFHVLRILGNDQISAARARELIDVIRKGEKPELPPFNGAMEELIVKHMVDRFLGWRLPENFSPDAGISFKPTFNDHMPFGPQKYNPVGTNLFAADQAEAMVRYMIEGMPPENGDALSKGDER